LLLAEVVILQFALLAQFLLQRFLEVLHVDLQREDAAAEGVRHVCHLEVVDAQQVRDRVHDSRLHALDQPLQVLLLRVAQLLYDDLELVGVFVLVERDLSEDLVDPLLGEDEIFVEHLLELEFLALGLLCLVVSHYFDL
jgi:hypothetical protein